MKVVLIIYCVLTILFVGGCGLFFARVGGAQGLTSFIFMGLFAVAVLFNIAFLILVNSGSANRKRNLKAAAIAYVVIGGASILLMALLSQSRDAIPVDLAELIVFAVAVKAAFVYAIGSSAPAK